jgi:anthranilate phosphoribosyltransferase
VKRQVLGVFHPAWTEKLAAVLRQLKSVHVLVLSGENGLDELSFGHASLVSELKKGELKSFRLDASGWGYAAADFGELAGSDAKTNAKIILSILQRENGPQRAAAALNAAAAIYVAGKSGSIRDGLPPAEEAIDSGRALQKLEQLIKESNRK